MKRTDFLKRLGMSRDDFRDLLQKGHSLRESLNEAQWNAVLRSLPKADVVLKSFGDDVTEDELNAFLQGVGVESATVEGGAFGSKVLGQNPGGGDQ